ncbi:hypothetical protein TIFTF001_006171 [Ficus carica]|uniref:Uncharacterized protein n=1 Tax=Ficus carica TaxID=3494 RepID=A0AA87ZZX1_FICCA|nr:hypothetical protein TIFTF001_006171 [Ficus carica]
MGNCVNVLSYKPISEKVRVVTNNGRVLEFEGLTPVKKITTSGAYKGYNLVHHSQPFSPLSPKYKLEPGEVYYLVPRGLISPKVVLDHDHHDDHDDQTKRQKIKIVVTREQLELLLLRSCSKQLQFKDVCVGVLSESFFGFNEEEGSSKWRPSLASIEEAQEEMG